MITSLEDGKVKLLKPGDRRIHRELGGPGKKRKRGRRVADPGVTD